MCDSMWLLQSLQVKVEKHMAPTVASLFPHGLTQEDVTANSGAKSYIQENLKTSWQLL